MRPEGAFSFEVSIDGVSVGSSASVPEKTLLANIAKAVCVEGADVPDPLAFNPELADARILSPEGGKVRIEAAPSEEADAAFFFRVGVRQD